MSGENPCKALSIEQIILRSTRSGDIEEFGACLNKSRVEILNWRHSRSGESCLLLCARYGQVDMLRCLVEDCGESLEQWNSDGKRALHEAALGGHLECVRYLINKDVEIDCLKRADWTPLMLACTKDNMDIISELIEAGANPKLSNKDGWTAFHIATREGHLGIVQYFLDMFPTIWDTVSNNGRTPLHTAALHGHLETVELLLKCGHYKPDCMDSCGTTPLMDSIRGNFVDVADLLITKHHARSEARDKLGRQCIHIAAQSGSLSSLKFLVDTEKVDVQNGTDFSGMTALHVAAKEGHDNVVSFLLENGSRINSKDKNGRTALHLASAAGQTCTVYRLVNHSACDVTTRDNKELVAADYALKTDVIQIFTRSTRAKVEAAQTT
ncbi:ankyrin repeat domain-containing protein 16-like [Dendronephthya gigantea]|uniref:ankyrin repeat domain-containing protein 16-like n=1 Tax=Dendronephthya gigantea TaxID=151771 RepID=UPI0010695E0D|nr:ankyrin repeat domain-containing protein 16-like [Dendronephthya gigantea]